MRPGSGDGRVSEEAQARSLGHPYFPQLDGLRTFCVIFTVLAHVKGVPWFIDGSVGVDIFFPLSGFLITSLLIREYLNKGKICLLCFYVRRIFRIAPLYYLTVMLYLLTALFIWVVLGEPEDIHNVLAVLPWLLAISSELRPIELGGSFYHAWTVGIEEKYYIFWPLIFMIGIGAVRLADSRQWILLLLSTAMLAVLWPFPALFRGYGGLLVGSLLAWGIATKKFSLTEMVAKLSTHFWFAAMSGAYLVIILTEDRRFHLLLAVAAAGFIAAIVTKSRDFYQRILSTPGIWHLGLLTYAIYLTHRLVLSAVERVAEVVGIQSWVVIFFVGYSGAVCFAFILHRFVERPLIKQGKILSDRVAARRGIRSHLSSIEESK